MHRRQTSALLFFAFFAACAAIPGGAADWPRWTGNSRGNMISREKGLPDWFNPGKKSPTGAGIDPATTRNVKWVARLGSNAYGNPTIADGRVFVGTDDLTLSKDPRFSRTRGGLVKCLDEETGKLLWQLAVPVRTDLPEGIHFSHQHLGVCSSPTVDGDRVYVVTSGGDIVCLDVNGQADGNDGPFTDEGRYMVASDKPPVELTATDADIIWRFDPINELGVFVHDAASCSILIHGDVAYTGTSNGVEATHEIVPAPEAPSLIGLDKRSGRLVAIDNEKIGTRMYHAQWSSPSLAEVNGKPLIFFGGGDGVCYAFEAIANAGEGDAGERVAGERVAGEKPVHLKKVWSYDCIPPHYKFRDGKPIPYYDGDKRKKRGNTNDGTYVGPSQLIATPTFYRNKIYLALGQDPAHGRGRGMMHCIDATKTGDITETGRVWTYDALDRTMATVAVADGLVYVPDVTGRLHCLDSETGVCYWVHDTKAETWGGPLVADGKMYLGNKRNFYVMKPGKTAKVIHEIRLGSPAYSTPVAANGVLYVMSQRYLWAVSEEP